MINTIEALQGLYVALGGDISDVANVTTIPEMLTLISTVAEAAASELPVVNASDNGNVLTVVNGKWGKANVPTELPAVTGDDIGKVLSVVSDGDEGAEYSLETPSGGLPEIENKDKGAVLTVNEDKSVSWNKVQTFAATVSGSQGGSWSVNLANGISRSDMVTQVQNNTGSYNVQIIYSFSDYGQLGGYICSNTYTYDNGVVFSGVLKKMGSEAYYQVIVNIGATASDDKVYLIPITTT